MARRGRTFASSWRSGPEGRPGVEMYLVHHAARRTDNKHLLFGLELSCVAQAVEGSHAGDRNGCGLLEAEVRWFGREALRPGAGIFREGAVARPVHRVTLLEPRDVSPGRLDGPGGVRATNANLGLAESKAHDADQIGLARHQMPDAWVDACSMHADEQIVVSGLWYLDVARLEHVGRAVLVLNDGFHGCLYFLPLLPSARPPSLLSSRLPTGPRQTVDLPSHDEMEGDERENANERARREDRPAVWMPPRPQPPHRRTLFSSSIALIGFPQLCLVIIA